MRGTVRTHNNIQNSDARRLTLPRRDLNFDLSVDIHTIVTGLLGGPELSHEEVLYDRVLTIGHHDLLST